MKKKQHTLIKEQTHFDELAEKYGHVWWGSMTQAGRMRLKRRGDMVNACLKKIKGPKVLEIGCGTGDFSQFIVKKRLYSKFIGIDISPKTINVIRKKFQKFRDASFKVADASSSLFKANYFDIIVGNSILHHIDVEKALRACYRILKKGGLIFFFEPNMINPQVAIEKNVKLIGKLLQNTEEETAFIRFKLKKLLRNLKYKNVVVEPFDFLHPFVPPFLIKAVNFLQKGLERIPLIKEIAGSIYIFAKK